MIYYTETLHYDHDSLKNALGKGRDDYFEVLRRLGFTRIAIPSFRKSRFMSVKERLEFEHKLTRAWRNALRQVRPGDTLIIHSPNSEKFLSYARMIKKLHERGINVITLTFELETFFVMDYRRFARLKRFSSKRTEAVLFNNSDAIVVHNDVMKSRLGNAGFDTAKMFSVGVMDYLCEEPLSDAPVERIGKGKPVIYAGHLSQEKSTFEYDLPKGFRCNLYGPDYTGPVNDDVRYKGVFDPVDLMKSMEGSFGLVWEGNSCDGCYGAYGDYLTFNNPHKIALYIASGIPVITWSGAAMAGFVRKEKCGIIVDNLYCVPEILSGLSDEEYENMRLNACRVGREMRKGLHIMQAVKSALEYVDGNAEQDR
ncbi:MAG: hypothetical protein IJG48_03385 [Mogibacterium sp.]|nr:hypothetical protein [Mogibacterium sp.]